MSDIFISYANEDAARIGPLVEALERLGWTVFWDHQVPPGLTWEKDIGGELGKAKSVVVAWSKASIKSDYVMEEARVAKARDVLIPIRLETVEPPFGYGGIHAADLSGWTGSSDAPEFKTLVKSGLSRLLGEPPGEKQEPETADLPAADDSQEQPPAKGTPSFGAMLLSLAQERSTALVVVVALLVVAVYFVWPIVFQESEPEMVLIPGGTFLMGSPESEDGRLYTEGPQHAVTLPGFYIGRYEVTNEEYRRFIAGHEFPPGQEKHPVGNASWEDASSYADWLGCRLPTEAEWEYAARAGTTEPYLSGKEIEDLNRFAWYLGNSPNIHPVGKKEANDWGLYDALGNVWEWVEDDFHGSYQGVPIDGSAGVDEPRSGSRVLRGGAFSNAAQFLRVACRLNFPLEYRDSVVGFRVVCRRSGGQ